MGNKMEERSQIVEEEEQVLGAKSRRRKRRWWWWEKEVIPNCVWQSRAIERRSRDRGRRGKTL